MNYFKFNFLTLLNVRTKTAVLEKKLSKPNQLLALLIRYGKIMNCCWCCVPNHVLVEFSLLYYLLTKIF